MAEVADPEPEIPQELRDAVEKLRNRENPPAITVRELLRYFGARRRGIYVVQAIKNVLGSLQIITYPDFEETWIDGEIQFVPIPGFGSALPKPVTMETAGGSTLSDQSSSDAALQHPRALPQDPTFRIGALDAANREVVTVKPDEPISLAITRMLAYDYSQLPVMTSPREVKGMISWSSVGSGMALRRDMAAENEASAVRHFMEKHYVVGADESFFEALPIIVDRGYVLVRAADNRITGIVTASDVAMEFKQRAEPFLLLSEIEQHVRNLIDSRIPLEELRKVRNPVDDGRIIERTSDLALGECERVFQNHENWIKLNLGKRLMPLRPVARLVVVWRAGIPLEQITNISRFGRRP